MVKVLVLGTSFRRFESYMAESSLGNSVKVAQQNLSLLVWVRSLLSQLSPVCQVGYYAGEIDIEAGV